jgi:signal transduction histidine kinase
MLTGVSLAVWLLALAGGRWVCRRALRPVQVLAGSARSMDGTDLGQRLPALATADEVADLSTAFNGLLDRLQEAFERQRRFTGDASHQLRTPLAALLGQVEVTLRRERPAREYRDTLGLVHRQATHLRQIVESLLFLARADAEARLPNREPIDLAAWLKEHLRSWSDHPRSADLRLEPTPEALPPVEAHSPLLGELVDILLDNACKHSPPGSPVTQRLGREGGRVLLVVEDRGCGIAAEDLPHVFEPFFRSADARRRGVAGLGLGLAIARRIAGACGGTLTAGGSPGGGAVFTLSLPCSDHRGPGL